MNYIAISIRPKVASAESFSCMFGRNRIFGKGHQK
jgi:hypothetical protein